MKPMPKYCISKWRQWGLGQPENRFTSNSASESVSSSARVLPPCARNPLHRRHHKGRRWHNRPMCRRRAILHGRNRTHRGHRNGTHRARPNRTNRNRPHPSIRHRRVRNRRAGNTPCRLPVSPWGQAMERGRNNACRQNGNAPSAGATNGSLKTRRIAESADSPRPSSRSRHTPSDRRSQTLFWATNGVGKAE